MTCRAGSLLTPVRSDGGQEVIEAILVSPHVRIERIVSHANASPEGFGYDQEESEGVLVVQGRARLQFENEPDTRTMGPGDYVHIPAHTRHRIEWTTPAEPTIWLAIFYPPKNQDQ